MIHLDDIKSDQYDWCISLKKLIGKDVSDIEGYICREFGDVSLKIIKVVLSDGTRMDVEGEHDFPYLCACNSSSQPNFNDETLGRLYAEGNPEE